MFIDIPKNLVDLLSSSSLLIGRHIIWDEFHTHLCWFIFKLSCSQEVLAISSISYILFSFERGSIPVRIVASSANMMQD